MLLLVDDPALKGFGLLNSEVVELFPNREDEVFAGKVEPLVCPNEEVVVVDDENGFGVVAKALEKGEGEGLVNGFTGAG